MPLVEKTIASSGGDYTSLSLAEASIPASSADDFEFTYIDDLDDTTAAVFSVTGFTGTVLIDVDESYRCYGAVSGAHAQLRVIGSGAAQTFRVLIPNVTVRHLRIMRVGSVSSNARPVRLDAAGTNCTIDRCVIIRDCTSNIGDSVQDLTTTMLLMNSFIVSRTTPNSMVSVGSGSQMLRCCLFLQDGTTTNMVNGLGANSIVKQTIAMKGDDATLTTGVFAGTWNAACDLNVSSDTSCPGTNHEKNVTPETVYAVLTNDSEDLHYPDRESMTDRQEGSDISGTTGTLDIDDETIQAWYPGADFYSYPEIDVQRPASTSIADGDTDSVAGTVAGVLTTLTYTIENLGEEDLVLGGTPVTISGQTNCTAVLNGGQPSSPIAPSGTETFSVDVTPTAAGAWEFELDIASDDPDESNYDITVSGTADPPPVTVALPADMVNKRAQLLCKVKNSIVLY